MTSFWRALSTFIYRHRLVGKRAIFLLNRILPGFLSKRLIFFAEKMAFHIVPDYQGDTLPPIFHYWSHRYIAPKLAPLGFKSPEDLYFTEIKNFASPDDSKAVSVVSFGSGAATLELELLGRLQASGVNVRFLCVDFNKHLKSLAEAAAARMGLAGSFDFMVADCNKVDTVGVHDIVIVNQFFHHVENIEGFCSLLERSIQPSGALLTCDVVGRNGHVLWPSVDKQVQLAWRALGEEKQYDRYFGARRERYISIDHSAYSNEGVRAQDVVEGLSKSFDFEVFVTYGAAVMPFVERRIGFNFDPDDGDDRNFIDKTATADDNAIASGLYPASNMIAVLRHHGTTRSKHYFPISPDTHIELTKSEYAAVMTQ